MFLSSSKTKYVQLPNLNFTFQFLMMFMLIFFLLIIPHAFSLSFNFTSFDPNDKNMKYKGSTSPIDLTIHLKRNQQDQAMTASVGRATYNLDMQLWDQTTGKLTDLTLYFSFVIRAETDVYGDGLAFFLDPAYSKIPNVTKRGAMGSAHNNQVLNSTNNPFIAVEFDIYENNWDPPKERVGVNINSMRFEANVTWLDAIKEGILFTGFNNDTLLQQNLSHKVDLRDYLPEHVTLGFSAAIGNTSAIPSIYSWNFASTLEEFVYACDTFVFGLAL